MCKRRSARATRTATAMTTIDPEVVGPVALGLLKLIFVEDVTKLSIALMLTSV